MVFDALFVETNFSKLPHKITEFLPTLSKKPSSLFVLVYIVRHTLGWQQETVPLTLDELQNGRKKSSGERYDDGTGLSRPTIISSLKFLEEHQTITIQEIDNERCFGLNTVGKTILPEGLNDFTDSGKTILPVDVSGDSNEAENEGPKETIKKTTTKKTTTAPPDAGQNSNGHNAATPDTDPLQKVPVEPKTAHQKLFEYVANEWYRAFKYSDGQYYLILNGNLEPVTGGEIGSAIKRFKKHFGDKVKAEDLKPFVDFYKRKCSTPLTLPRSDYALLRWVNEWKEEKRRFDPNEDPYEALVIRPQDVKGNGK